MEKKEVKTKKKINIKVLIIVLVSLLTVGIVSFFLVKKFTSLEYKLTKVGYSSKEVITLKKVLNNYDAIYY